MSYTMESFISYCDDMMIAEESAREIKSFYKKENEKILQLKKQIEANKDDFDKQVSLYKEVLKHIGYMKSEVSKMDVNGFDRGVSVSAKAINAVLPIMSTFAVYGVMKKYNVDFGRKTASASTGIFTAVGLHKLLKGFKSRSNTKVATVNTLSVMEKSIQQYITMLSDKSFREYVKKNGMSEGNSYEESLSNTNHAKIVTDATPLCNKLVSETKSLLEKIISKYKIQATVEVNDKDKDWITLSADIDNDYYNENENTCLKAEEEFDDLLHKIKTKYTSQLNKYNIEFGENTDEMLLAYIRVDPD